jgi:hypothetical protein
MNNNGVWSAAQTIGSGAAVGEAVAPPAICLDSAASSLWAVAIGTDNQVWTTHQNLGASSWPNWTPQGAFAGDLNNGIQAPSCAAANNGNVGLAYVGGDLHPHYKIMNSNGGTVSNWAEDSTGWQTEDAIQLTSSGPTIFTLFTGLPGTGEQPGGTTNPKFNSNDVSESSGYVYWKQLYAAQ